MGGEHLHVLWQQVVGAVHQAAQREARRRLERLEVDRLAAGVHPGVGAAGAHRPHRRRQQPSESPLQHFLHGDGVGLALPAGVGRAAIRDDQADDHPRPVAIKIQNGAQMARNSQGINGTPPRWAR